MEIGEAGASGHSAVSHVEMELYQELERAIAPLHSTEVIRVSMKHHLSKLCLALQDIAQVF